MLNQFTASDFLIMLGALITGVLGAIVTLKGTKATAEGQFREDLLTLVKQHSDRISALEDENRELLQKNQQLANTNLEERKHQQEMSAQLTALEKERATMASRIEYLENRLREVSERMEKLLHER
jgi:chromosome segregation ATPase